MLTTGGLGDVHPSVQLRVMPTQLTGRTPASKLQQLREQLTKRKASGTVVTALDDVAWLYDLRGNDIPYNPVFFAYCTVRALPTKRRPRCLTLVPRSLGTGHGAAYVGLNDARLYVAPTAVDEAVRAHLGTEVSRKGPTPAP